MGKGKGEQVTKLAADGWSKFVAARQAKAQSRATSRDARHAVDTLMREFAIAGACAERADALLDRTTRDAYGAVAMWEKLELYAARKYRVQATTTTEMSVDGETLGDGFSYEGDTALELDGDCAAAPLYVVSLTEGEFTTDGAIATIHSFAYATARRGVFAIVIKRETVRNGTMALETIAPSSLLDVALRAAVAPHVAIAIGETERTAIELDAIGDVKGARRLRKRAVVLDWYASTTPESGRTAQLGWKENHNGRDVIIGAQSSAALAMTTRASVKRHRAKDIAGKYAHGIVTEGAKFADHARPVRTGDVSLTPHFAPVASRKRKPSVGGRLGPWDLWASVSAIGADLDTKPRKRVTGNGKATARVISPFEFTRLAELDAMHRAPVAFTTSRREREEAPDAPKIVRGARANLAAFAAYGAAERCAFLAIGF